ncbi:hypothetical protein IWW37_005409 [Coemansia sp. RSA 2050]|nr:hypothetical protein IWW37_005409 [Coemansia sp. RSA 2050]
MFIKPLLTCGDAEKYVKGNKKKKIIFLPNASADGYLKFKNQTNPLVLILLEEANKGIEFTALAIEGVKDFKEKKEILIDEGVAFFGSEEATIVNKDFDPENFIKSLEKFKNPTAKPAATSKGREKDYDCTCCVIL